MPVGLELVAVRDPEEPGLGVLLVPPGALALVAGVWLTARGLRAG